MTTSDAPPAGRLSMRLTHVGALIEETYAAFRHWDLAADVPANLARLRAENPIGARTDAWLRAVAATLSARFRAAGDVAPLVILAQGGLPLEEWKPCLLWHVARIDALFHAFLTDWLYPAYRDGVARIRTHDAVPFVLERTAGRLRGGESLNERTAAATAQALLRLAADFGLLKGRVAREFASYHLDDAGFLYALHALAAGEPNPRRLIDSPEWRIFLLAPDDVERELLRLHQFRRVEYQAAGSLAQLTLPCPSLRAYAESLVA